MTPKRAWLAAVCILAAACVLALIFFSTRPRTSTHSRRAPVNGDQTRQRAESQGTTVAPIVSAATSTAPLATTPANASSAQTRAQAATAPAAPADPVKEPHFAAFNAWLDRYQQAAPADRSAMETEGVALARQRRAALFSLIQTDPRRAIALGLSRSVTSKLPANVASLIEEQISARGDYSVLAALALPGLEKEVQPITRTMKVGDRTYRAFTYGRRADHPTRARLPFRGLAIDDVLAVNDDPVYILPPSEAAALGATAKDAVCAISGEPATANGEPTVLDIGGELIWTCRYDHIAQLREQQLAAAGTAGGGTVDGSSTLESNYTEGRKRMIVFRVAFPNVTTPAMTVATGMQLITNVNTFWRTMSYGRTTVAMPGQGSDVVQVTLSLHSTNYDGDAGKLRGDVLAAAAAAGIDYQKYDFDMTCVGSTPAYTFAGLGYVGARGLWLANSYFGVATACHELGHNLGNPHANYWDTGGESDIGPGGNEEYGDPYDIMGNAGAYAGHYVNKFKWRIGWIPTNDFPRITTGGLYRIYSHDNIDSTGLRGLRIPRVSGSDYHVEFRQLYTGNNWMMNGLKLMWGDPNGWGSQLIDTTPGSANGKNDAAIVIGRTWADTSAGVYLTPIGKGNTYPESLDVVVNLGSFPTNLAPTGRIAASSTNPATGSSVTFTVSATDPNGDAVAYYWNFDDGGYSTDNNAVQTHTFSSAGDYTVTCTVSDMKGGKHTSAILVRVGSPTTYTVSGRVLDKNKPLEGALVKAGSRSTYTRSDGTYILTRLSAGSYNVTAALYPYTLISPWSPVTVTVGPSATNIDFINLPGGLPPVTLVSTGSVWKYLDNGTDQGTAWSATAFDDSTWASGPAQLGYGDNDEATVVSYGPDANNKYVTTYFRRAFTVSDPTAVTNLVLRLQRDDGGIVYLNGTEAFRDGMQSGTVNYRTFASTTTDGEWVQTNLNRSLLVAGSNVFAVEIHQVNGTSSDISFDLELAGTSTSSTQSYSALYVASPSDGSTLTSTSTPNVTAVANFSGDSYTLLEFYADGAKFGQASAAPYAASWPTPAPGNHVLTVRGTVGSGGFQTSAPVNVTVVAPAAPPTGITLVSTGSVWKYLDNGSDQGTAWIDPNFNDTAWASGPAELGYGDLPNGRPEATVLCCSNAVTKNITYYFRRAFNVDDPTLVTNLAVHLLRDDGGVVYLNGVEVFRSNMPTGSITSATFASTATSDDGTVFYSNSVSPALLTAGRNVLAVEIHQDAVTSSDISFDLQLAGLVASNRSRGVYITAPSGNVSYAAPVSPTLSAVAIPASGQSITNVAFFAGATRIADDPTAPFSIVWSNAPGGTFAITAVAYETSGATLTSAPVQVTITAPRVGQELVSPNAMWRYLDDGSDQGTAWRARLFNDSDWQQGYARLGYGNDGELTTVSYGSDPNHRYITTYFRRAFTLTSTNVSDLKLLLTRDDGAVVYINGTEVHRVNMPTNVIAYNSLAATTMNSPDETNWFTSVITGAPLVVGTNVVAVEVHQATLTSSDLGMDLQLIAEYGTNVSTGAYVTTPANGAKVTLPHNVPLNIYASAPAGWGPVVYVTYFTNGAALATVSTAPYSFTWTNPPVGTNTITARVVYASTSFLDTPSVMITSDGPPVPISTVLDSYIAQGSTWRAWTNGTAPASAWTALEFDDAPWISAPAKFGWGLDGELTTLPSGRTHYFRKTFTCSNPAIVSDLIAQLQRDDGAIVYLNGVELYRSNMPAGTITSNTLASSTADGLDEQTFFMTSIAAPALLVGSNVVAVEIHQASTTSSDMGFDMQLNGSGNTAPRIAFARPAAGQIFILGSNVTVEANPWPGSTRSVAKVEFFNDGVKIGEATSSPWRATWAADTLGSHTLTARLVDNFGATVNSDPLPVMVGYQSVSVVLIASNSVWKYLDNGSNQGTNWSQTNYSDATWASGAARLGYGGDGEVTTVSYGPVATAKYITTYFRKQFVVPDSTIITNLTCKLVRDDGAVLYINGREMYRSNMPNGTVTYTTLASSTTSNGDEKTFFVTSLAITNLFPGTNWLAVEIHQDAITSSDIGFDLEVDGDGYQLPNVPPAFAPTFITGSNLRLAWPSTSSGFNLYRSSQVGTGANWQLITLPVTTSNGQNTVTIPTTNAAGFFRLQK